jgi:hypothetical protein
MNFWILCVLHGHNASDTDPLFADCRSMLILLSETKEARLPHTGQTRTLLEVVSRKDVVWQMNRENLPSQEVASRNGSIDLGFELRSSSFQIAKLIVREDDDKLSRLAGILYFEIA